MTDFWSGVARGELWLARCNGCAAHRHFPAAVCPTCHAGAHTQTRATGVGVLASYTRVHRGPSADFKDLAPYTLVLVTLEEGPRVMAWWAGREATPQIGARVQARYVDGPGARKLLAFAPLDHGGT